jgi:hypothetical protein
MPCDGSCSPAWAPTRPPGEDVYDAVDRAQQRLGMPVNPVLRSADAWRLASDPLVRQVQSSPLVTVLIPEGDSSSGPLPDIR